MKNVDFKALSPDQAAEYAHGMTPEALETHIGKMNTGQIVAVIEKITEGKKIRAAIKGLNEKPILEEVGRAISVPQIFEILTIEDKDHWKLTPILVGISHETFSKLLLFATEKEIKILKFESISEPIQHHLIILAHELEKILNESILRINTMHDEIKQLDISKLGIQEIQQLYIWIDALSMGLLQLLKRTNIALGITWNSGRVDLIQTFNEIKERSQRLIKMNGLYNDLTKKLESVYNDPNQIEGVRDLEPAIEGLAKLSIWYLRDYLELGLLPGIKSSADLDVDLPNQDEKEKLFALARQTLDKLGLQTVSDLKKACIFSRKTLKEFIDRNKT